MLPYRSRPESEITFSRRSLSPCAIGPSPMMTFIFSSGFQTMRNVMQLAEPHQDAITHVTTTITAARFTRAPETASVLILENGFGQITPIAMARPQIPIAHDHQQLMAVVWPPQKWV